MDPNSGRILTDADLSKLREHDPAEAAKFSVRLEGTQEEVEKIAAAVQRDQEARGEPRQEQGGSQGAEVPAMNTDTIRDTLVVDAGPVAAAAVILAEQTTLAEHVTVDGGDWTTTIAMTGDIPFQLWGSGTQALWRLLSAIAYTSEQVSLYEVASRLDQRNSAAAARALAALFGSPS